jgi:hypothetical protein
LVSHLILFIFEVRDFKVLVTSSSFGLYSAGLEEEGISSLYLFFSLSYFFFNFSDPRMLESTFMDASFIYNKVVDLLSLNRRENSMTRILFPESPLGRHNSLIYLYSVEFPGETWNSSWCLIFVHHQRSYLINVILSGKYTSLHHSLATTPKDVGPKVYT